MHDSWAQVGAMPPLADGDLQIWRLDLGGPDSRGLLAHAFQALTSEERQRAARMRSGTAPEEFIAGRGYLRRLLGAELDCDPQGIGLVVGPHRKPEIRPIRGVRVPLFNVSHSRGMVLIALSRAGSVGVDVEFMDGAVEALDVARGAFHPLDLAQIEGAASPPERLRAFYRCWTRREAVAKADGRGLTLPASEFCAGTDAGQDDLVDLDSEDTGKLESRYSSRYFVSSVEVGSSYQGAVAVSRPGTVPHLFDLTRLSSRSSTEPNISMTDEPQPALLVVSNS